MKKMRHILLLLVVSILGMQFVKGQTNTTCTSTFIQKFDNLANTGQTPIGTGSKINIFPNPAGGFFITGLRMDSTTISFFDNNDILIWTRKFRFSTAGRPHQINDMFVNSDGDLIGVSNYLSSEGVIFKYNISANAFVWIQKGSTYYTNIHSLNANDCIVTGTRSGKSHLLRIDKATGSVINYSKDGAGGDFYSVLQNNIIYGTCRRYWTQNTDLRASLFAHDANTGNALWQKSLITVGPGTTNSPANPNTRMYPVAPIYDNNNLLMLSSGDLSGFDTYISGDVEMVLVKTDISGIPAWTKQYVATGFTRPNVAAIANTTNGYFLVGNFYSTTLNDFSDGFVIKTDKNGTVLWAKKLGITNRNQINNIMERNGFLYLAMSSRSYSSNNDLLLVKMDNNGNTDTSCHLLSDLEVSVIDSTNRSNDFANTTNTVAITLNPLSKPVDSIDVKTTTYCIKCCPKTISITQSHSNGKYCKGDSICLSAGINSSQNPLGGYKYQWYKSIGTGPWTITNVKDTLPNPCILIGTVGTHKLHLVVSTNSGLCIDSAHINVQINPLPIAQAGADKTICAGLTAGIGTGAINGNTYSWTSSPAGFTSSIANPSVNPTATTTYYLNVVNTSTQCAAKDTILVTVNNCPPTTSQCEGANGYNIFYNYNLPTSSPLSSYKMKLELYKNGALINCLPANILVKTPPSNFTTYTGNTLWYFSPATCPQLIGGCIDYRIIVEKQTATGTTIITTVGNFGNNGVVAGINNDLCCGSVPKSCPSICTIQAVVTKPAGGGNITLSNSSTNLSCGKIYYFNPATLSCNPVSSAMQIKQVKILDALGNTPSWASVFTGTGNLNIPAGTTGSFFVKYVWGTAAARCDSVFYPINITCCNLVITGTPNCSAANTNTNSITLNNPTGGTAPYTYLWSNGSTSQNLTMVTTGQYSVTVTDANGCSKNATFNITCPPPVIFHFLLCKTIQYVKERPPLLA